MAAALDVGVREFVDQHDLRPAGDDGVEVHFVEPLALVFEPPARHDFQTFQQRFGFAAAVGLDDADDDVVAVLLAGMGLLQHLVGLADAGRRADEDAKLADAALFAARRFEQGFRRGPIFGIAPLIRHHCPSIELVVGSCGLPGGQLVEREIELQDVDARLAQKAEEAPLDVIGDELHARDFRPSCGPWQHAAPGNSAASGEISGSSPLADVVTRSIGTAAEGFSFFSLSMSPCTRSISALLEGPRFEPPELAAL